MAPLTSIRTKGNDIEIINQLLLPHEIEWIPIHTVEEAHSAIKTMKIRGAPAIASLAALSIASHMAIQLEEPRAGELSFLSSPSALQEYLQPKIDFLFTARPTAVNLGAAMKRLTKVLEDGKKANKWAVNVAKDVVLEGREISNEDVGRNKEMSKNGAEWLIEEISRRGGETEPLNVLTVCNTGYGTALGLITHLHETGKLKTAYYTQSAPYHQVSPYIVGSRLTSMELQSLAIPSVMICDTMVGSLFTRHPIHAVAVGADRIAKNGDTANKVGTYQAAVLAARHGIPFLVVAPIATVDLDTSDGSAIHIEERPAIEARCVRGAVFPIDKDKPTQATVMYTPPEIDGVYNPSFDVTPADLITAIVTEKGVATKRVGQKMFDLSHFG
ncbi:S-methyl-5-thioribose-1-phosphate isomerase [Tulasnella sp. 330]|nr:S-methyl-5-thioribose-1-phosphate isomerase [Tulasnella sp. 330]KAG8885770.1 S-methyl-5-thioribose-1-phosphate isomerase [Tulasnella sp. 331]